MSNPPQPVEQVINSDQIIALVGVFMQASDGLPEAHLTAVINQILTQERTLRLDPRVPPEAVENLKTNRKALELFRTLKVGLRTLREGPQIAVPTLLHPGLPS